MTKAASGAKYTLEFKHEVVRLVEGGQSVAAARTLGVVDQTLFNWVKAHRRGLLDGVDSKGLPTQTTKSINHQHETEEAWKHGFSKREKMRL